MAIQQLQIKDIFIGSIDAKDDFQRNRKEFVENFLVPYNFEISDFYTGKKFIVEGYKGTGKTALLNYLRTEVDNEGVSSFILFKSEYNTIDKTKLESISSNIIEVDKDLFLKEVDFEYVWKWIFLAKMVDFNIENNYKFFVKNKKWDQFEKAMRYLSSGGSKKKSLGSFFSKIKPTLSIGVPSDDIIYSLGLEMKDKSDFDFIEVLESTLDLYASLERTDKPAYVFIDELETFYTEKDVFHRDLRLIRDLIFTVKYFNDLEMNKRDLPVRFICAVRTEILDSISRFVSGKELNKITYSHRQELKWIYNQVAGYNHPIIQIWIKRIKSAELRINKKELTSDEIIEKWFPQNIHSSDIVSYILHNTWYKPRDIIRFMQSARNCAKDKFKYDQQTLVELVKEYSKESWKEITEELNAKYTIKEISYIKDFLLAYRDRFSFEQAIERAEKVSRILGNEFLKDNIADILKDLYRIGVIGNVTVDRRYYRWHHKGDQDVLISDDNHLFEVHNALRNVLSIYYVNLLGRIDVEINEPKIAKVVGVNTNRVNVKIEGSKLTGYITRSNLLNTDANKDLTNCVHMNESLYVKVLHINKSRQVSLRQISKDNYEDLIMKKDIELLKEHVNK